ncbi:hypothetical protein MVEG_04040 [Podila verticillata NRRL 6337]|nr:hypothetical protein MVEG_04040 [Podila verticillata NRRL 6337]
MEENTFDNEGGDDVFLLHRDQECRKFLKEKHVDETELVSTEQSEYQGRTGSDHSNLAEGGDNGYSSDSGGESEKQRETMDKNGSLLQNLESFLAVLVPLNRQYRDDDLRHLACNTIIDSLQEINATTFQFHTRNRFKDQHESVDKLAVKKCLSKIVTKETQNK